MMVTMTMKTVKTEETAMMRNGIKMIGKTADKIVKIEEAEIQIETPVMTMMEMTMTTMTKMTMTSTTTNGMNFLSRSLRIAKTVSLSETSCPKMLVPEVTMEDHGGSESQKARPSMFPSFRRTSISQHTKSSFNSNWLTLQLMAMMLR